MKNNYTAQKENFSYSWKKQTTDVVFAKCQATIPRLTMLSHQVLTKWLTKACAMESKANKYSWIKRLVYISLSIYAYMIIILPGTCGPVKAWCYLYTWSEELSEKTPHSLHMSEIWDVFCGFKIWSVSLQNCGILDLIKEGVICFKLILLNPRSQY